MLGLDSPRRRRRLAWTAGLGLPAAAAVVFVIALGNTGEPLATPTDAGAGTLPAEPTGPALVVTPAVEQRVAATVDLFAHTAVVRRRLDEAWPLASPVMRTGLTLAQWRRGDIPVQPFPAAALRDVDWRVVERFPQRLLLDVAMHPKDDSGERIAVYSVELSATGRGTTQRFLVDSWVPLAMLGDITPQAAPRGGTQAATPPPFQDAQLDAVWLLLPAAIGGLLVLALAGLVGRGIVVRRRAERDWREQLRQ